MPIRTRSDLRAYMAADLRAHGLTRLPWPVRFGFDKPTLVWQRLYRRTEFVVNARRGPLWRPWVLFWKWRLLRASVRIGFDIPLNVFGPGLCLVHWGTITVSALAQIGSNCRMHPSTCIGESHGLAPTLGDHVYIAPGAKLFGGITIGDGVQIGANAVVTKSFPAGVTVLGVPAKVGGAHPSSR